MISIIWTPFTYMHASYPKLSKGLATAPLLYASLECRELQPIIKRRFKEPGDAEKVYIAHSLQRVNSILLRNINKRFVCQSIGLRSRYVNKWRCKSWAPCSFPCSGTLAFIRPGTSNKFDIHIIMHQNGKIECIRSTGGLPCVRRKGCFSKTHGNRPDKEIVDRRSGAG